MEVRTQLAIVAAVALAWGAGHWVRVRPVMEQTREAERMSIGALEERVARHPDDAIGTRVLLRRYLDQRMTRLVVDTAHRAPTSVQQDGAVILSVARAQESLGNVTTANALVVGALRRCGALPGDLADGAGCDVRTQTELAFEGAALDRMIQWNITPLTDPTRASLAHELSTRPVRITARATP